ncbi:MAG: hypothetical protein KC493_15525 [Bacteriovoracaceae bacterium]|nr:hypothetical protein [Bacteriovoracaceae bacterium]
MKRMNLNLFITLLISLALSSCQIEGNKGSGGANQSSGVFELGTSTAGNLKRICDALKFKRDNIWTLNDRQVQVELNASKYDCGDAQVYNLGNFTADLRVNSSIQPFFEATGRSRFLSDIVSDSWGDIAEFCKAFKQNEAPVSRVILGDKTMDLEVTIDGSYDKFIIKKTFKSNPDINYYEIEEGTVHTPRTSQSEDLMGSLKRRTIKTRCPNGQQEYFIQTLVRIL